MSSYFDALEISLPATTQAGKARLQALKQIPWAPTPTTTVSYVSSIRVLIIADEDRALIAQAMLPEKMQAYLALLANESSVSKISNGWNVASLQIRGYLGRFEAFVDIDDINQQSESENNLGLLFNIANGLFDQVIDCSPQALVNAAIKPPGYYHVATDDELLENAIGQVSQLIGEFEKPRYFNYDPNICAHGSSGITGCTRCIDACPTQAIISMGNKIEVDPYLCQGGGSCASSCPSGAISYTYPKAEEQIEFLRALLQNIRSQNANKGICLLIYDNEHGAQTVAQAVSAWPEFIIPFVVEDIGSVGLDLLSSALAYGASQIVMYLPDSVAAQVSQVINCNIELLETLFDELELSQFQLQVVSDLKPLALLKDSQIEIDGVAKFSPVGSKRNTIRSALTHLNSVSTAEKQCVALPAGSLFGQINLDNSACTLCMACVSVCPGKALLDGGDSPALKFIEANCLQCGICANACPENAIELEARIHFDHNTTHSVRELKTEEPFRCLSCGKAFATQSMIKTMTEKLKGHWMFEEAGAMKRLQMCENCRVADMFADKET